MDVDWDALRAAAVDAATHGYAPYSGLQVGAAAITDRGTIVSGCNVENASYGLGLCAECGLVGNLHLSAASSLVALACRSATDQPLMPCGRCRQLLHEAGGPGLLIDSADGPLPLAELLPRAFGPTDLP